MMTDLRYELPAEVTVEKLIASLARFGEAELVLQEFCIRTFYDSFDWRLYQNEILCEFNRSQSVSDMVLKNLQNGRIFATLETAEMPSRIGQMKAGKVKTILKTYLEERALLPVCSLEFEAYHLVLRNQERRIILRLLMENYDLLNAQLAFHPVRGFLKTSEHIAQTLSEELAIHPAERSVLESALALEGRKPNDYSSKLKIDLEAKMPAEAAVKRVFDVLLKTMKLNEQGVITDLDSEFLHDFRVAVRRTRTGLSQLKSVLPQEETAHFTDFFSWLSQSTGPTRDLDVYLAKFAGYLPHIPGELHPEIEPFLAVLHAKRAEQLRELAGRLNSEKYRKLLTEWEHFLKNPAKPEADEADSPIKPLADRRIWKMYRRVIKEGGAIDSESPAGDLHELRKTCKKLRYLIEFFQSLYPKTHIRKLVKQLKGLQDVLGEFQDLDVQVGMIDQVVEEGVLPPATQKALHDLERQLAANKSRVRKRYQPAFEEFAKPKNEALFRLLFGMPD